jgi:hypothetical protein
MEEAGGEAPLLVLLVQALPRTYQQLSCSVHLDDTIGLFLFLYSCSLFLFLLLTIHLAWAWLSKCVPVGCDSEASVVGFGRGGRGDYGGGGRGDYGGRGRGDYGGDRGGRGGGRGPPRGRGDYGGRGEGRGGGRGGGGGRLGRLPLAGVAVLSSVSPFPSLATLCMACLAAPRCTKLTFLFQAPVVVQDSAVAGSWARTDGCTGISCSGFSRGPLQVKEVYLTLTRACAGYWPSVQSGSWRGGFAPRVRALAAWNAMAGFRVEQPSRECQVAFNLEAMPTKVETDQQIAKLVEVVDPRVKVLPPPPQKKKGTTSMP